MKLYKYLFVPFACILLTACTVTEKSPKYYYNDEAIHELIYAIDDGDTKKIQTLIHAGANVNTVGKNGVTPLFWSYLKAPDNPQKKDIFKLLLKNGANPMIIYTPEGKSVLTYAAINIYDSDYLRIILEEVPDINVDQYLEKTPHYPTALYHAIFNKNYDNVKLLLEHGADVNYPDNIDRTSLSLATGNRWDITYLLLQNGADYNYVGTTGRFNPFNRREIVQSLENNTYSPTDDPDNSREKVIKFIKEQGIEVYPLYEKDDPRFNPRPEITQYSVTNSETENAEKYSFSYQGNDLVELAIKDSIILFNQPITATLTYTKSGENFVLKNAIVAPEQKILNLNTQTELNKKDLTQLSASEIGIIIDQIELSLDFIFRNSSLEEIIDQYGKSVE